MSGTEGRGAGEAPAARPAPRPRARRRRGGLSFTTRLALMLAAGFVALQAALTAGHLIERKHAVDARSWMPFPDQLEAMVELFDQAGPADRALLARAFSDGTVLVHVADAAPQVDGRAGDMDVDRLSNMIRRYSSVLEGRELRAAIPADQVARVFPRAMALLNPDRLRFSIALKDGSWLVVQRQSATALTLGGLPIGQVSGAMAALLAGAVVLWVRRETKPLRELEAAAGAFAADLSPRPLRPRGAPDLRALIDAFNAMQDRIARLDRSRTDMIAAIAHDVRTPLTRLRLRLRAAPDALQEAVDRDIDEISGIAEEAYRFAAADLSALEERVNLAALVAAAIRGRDRAQAVIPPGDTFGDAPGDAAAARSGGASPNPAPGAWEIRGSAPLVARCLDNLVGNALKYGNGVTVTLAQGPAGPVVLVDDDGPGIPAAERARMLEPFARGEGSRNRSTGGAGLGLALAARILQRHGGTLSLEDAPTGGLRVRAAFPAAPRADQRG